MEQRSNYAATKDAARNGVIKGGACIRHGVIVKLCNSEGCANHAKKGVS